MINQNLNNNWKTFENSHTLGDVVDCTISKIGPNGIVTDIGGIEGVIHPSQIDGMNMAFKYNDIQIGKNIKAKIVGMSESKVSLSITSMLDSSSNPGSTGEDFGGISPSNTESDGEKFGATDLNNN